MIGDHEPYGPEAFDGLPPLDEEKATLAGNASAADEGQLSAAVERLGIILGERSDGGFDISCPWQSEHTTPGVQSATTYWPANGSDKPGFKCQHAHCARRTIKDFIAELRRRDHTLDRHYKAKANSHDRKSPPTSDSEPDSGALVPDDLPLRVQFADFLAYAPQGAYIFRPTGALWPAKSVNARLRPVYVGTDEDGEKVFIPASRWIDEHQPVEQMTWQPGEPEIIRHRLIVDGAWEDHAGASVYNHYYPPTLVHGDPARAGPFVELVCKVYPDDADHILDWFAHRVQYPGIKLNHMLLMGGDPGIGKDTMIEPLLRAVGERNAHTISPSQFVGRFNPFLKSVVLRVAEARSGQKFDRFDFYETLKLHGAAPPNTIFIDEKHIHEYAIANVVGIIITANKRSAFYLPSDDRRTYVAWSQCIQTDFEEGYFKKLWRWYERGGFGHVAAYLAQRDLSQFDAKAPPPKTDAFLDIVNLNRASEDAEFADAVDQLGNPKVVTLPDIREAANTTDSFKEWLDDRRNRRLVPHRFEAIDYEPVRNPDAKDGLWKVKYRRQVIYGRKGLSVRERLDAARKRTSRSGNSSQ